MSVISFCLNSPFNKKFSVDNEFIKGFSRKHSKLNTIKFIPRQDAGLLNVLLSASSGALTTNARGDLLRNNPIESLLTINSPSIDALFHTEIKSSLIRIAQENNIEIKIHLTSEPEIVMLGSIDALESARVQVLVLLDQLSGLHVAKLSEIHCYLHNLIAGRKHTQLLSIMEETSTNTYLQSPFSSLCQENTNSLMESGVIYLTGESVSSLNRAKEFLLKLSAQKLRSMYHKDFTLEAKKLDWVLLNKRIELRNIMTNNGSFFLFPALGSGSSSISIYAENRINVERSIRLLNYLTSNIYEATFDLIIKGKIEEILWLSVSQLSQDSGADVTFDSSNQKLSLFGTERQVIRAYQIACSMSFFKENLRFTVFSLELATNQIEFISGKKNGKINKIMKACTVTIRFAVSNEYNSTIIVESPSHANAFEGLAMLRDELPAETSFYVPEVYHRRIIGVAGKNIQKVMKKYGVYVKFSGAEEFASMGGYFENEDNVVARTPMKNKVNLENLKQSVSDFISFQKDREFIFTTMSVPHTLQRIIPVQFGSQLRELCRTNNAKIEWPERLGCDQVSIYSPQTQAAVVIAFVNQLITKEMHFSVETDSEILTRPDFIAKLEQAIKTTTGLEWTQMVISERSHQQGPLEWKLPYNIKNGHKVILYRLYYKDGEEQQLEKTIEIIKSIIRSSNINYNELAPTTVTLGSHDLYNKNSKQGHGTSLLASPIMEVHDNNSLAKDSVFTATFDSIPSPPLSENYHHAAPLHPHDTPPTSVSSFSSLSAPFPTGKNIWASPRIRSNNVIPPLVQMEQLYLSDNVHNFQQSSSQLRGLNAPSSSFLMDQDPLHQQRNLRIKPSISTPAICQPSQQLHHKSWPDAFFGGRDLFDTLPLRRASASTKYTFEVIPNSVTSTSNTSYFPPPPLHEQYQQQHQKSSSVYSSNFDKLSSWDNCLNPVKSIDHQSQFNVIPISPFLYSNAPGAGRPNESDYRQSNNSRPDNEFNL